MNERPQMRFSPKKKDIAVLLALIGVGLTVWYVRSRHVRAQQHLMSYENLHIAMGIGLHNYHDVWVSFPPAGIYGEDGAEYISWQTSLLPYVDMAPLYNQIDVRTPWTDPANRPYYGFVVRAYIHPSFDEDHVNSQGFAVSHYAGNAHIFRHNSATRVTEITDSTSSTVLVAEVATGFKAWGDPTNVRDPAAGLGIGPDTFSGPPSQDGTHVLMCDGSVKLISNNIGQDVLNAIATPSGGEHSPAF